ncbi:MAG TPA: radical SAM protein [Bryobacteraceae bacterium]|nr:radical SAM protein [Bryobacteraceae bacterium]
MRDFSEAPFLVIWEVTQACDLACVHCRASAEPARNPFELNTQQGYELLDEIRRFGDPLMVFTGGDPLKRPDLMQLIRHSTGIGLRTTVTPSATPLLTREAILDFKNAGVARMAISMDGPDAATHDGFRRVTGSFERTLYALDTARDLGLETQVNTTVTRRTVERLPEIARIVADKGAKLWSVFFLVTTGRAAAEDDLTAEEYEEVFKFLYETARAAPFEIKTTEAQHYRRYVAQQRKRDGGQVAARTAGAGINDGKGFVFVSHTGNIYPSGFLPVSAGNIRHDSLVDTYRNSPLFLTLRDSGRLGGKCGKCEFRNLCGGSRSRAFALTGDFLAEESRCTFQPRIMTQSC